MKENEDFGTDDFKVENKFSGVPDQSEEFVRVRIPRPGEVLGVIDQRLGSSRLRVRCLDGKTRLCRIPGRLKKKLWVREGDVVLVEPWEYSKEDKGDILYKYKPNQVDVLKKKGLFKEIDTLEEF